MSLYSRYSESSISVSYFSRSSALISSDVLLPELLPHLLSTEIVAIKGWAGRAQRTRRAFGHELGCAARRQPPHVDERIAVVRARTQPGQRAAVRGRAVALVVGETVAGVFGVHGDHQPVPADFRQHAGRGDTGGRR